MIFFFFSPYVEGKLTFKKDVSSNITLGELRASKNDSGQLTGIAMETARYQT